MSTPSELEAASRLAQAMAGFRRVQYLVMSAHRKLRDLPQEDVNRFWFGTGVRLKQKQHACATEVLAAYRSFSAEGGIAEARDRRLIGDAHQVLVGDAGEAEAGSQVDLVQRSTEFEVSRRLRLAIDAELERRNLRHASEIAAFLGLSTRFADRLLRRKAWKEGDLALLQAAAARLGLTV